MLDLDINISHNRIMTLTQSHIAKVKVYTRQKFVSRPLLFKGTLDGDDTSWIVVNDPELVVAGGGGGGVCVCYLSR